MKIQIPCFHCSLLPKIVAQKVNDTNKDIHITVSKLLLLWQKNQKIHVDI